MNRINPALFSCAFTSFVRETWPDRPDFVTIDGKTSRRSYDKGAGKAPLHLVSAFATTARLVLGQEAVRDKSNETTAIPVLLERLGQNGGLEGAIVSIDAIATNAATVIRVGSRTELKDRCRFDARYFISSAVLTAQKAAQAVRGHWLVENALHWTLDVVFRDDQSRLRRGHGAENMAVVRHVAINLARAVSDKRSSEISAINLDSEPWLTGASSLRRSPRRRLRRSCCA